MFFGHRPELPHKRDLEPFFELEVVLVEIVLVCERHTFVSVRLPRSDSVQERVLKMSAIDSGHLGAVYGWEEGSEEAVLVG